MLRRIALLLASAVFITAGILHFTKTSFYLKIVPPYIPWHLAMVQISGVCEILGGLGLLIPLTRRAAAWGLVALLIAVFPANVYMVTDPVAAGAASMSPVLLWGGCRYSLFLSLGCCGRWVHRSGASRQRDVSETPRAIR